MNLSHNLPRSLDAALLSHACSLSTHAIAALPLPSQVGLRDLHAGLKGLDVVLVGHNLGLFEEVRMALVLLLVAGVLGGIALLLLAVRPFIKNLHHESQMVAELLSQLPHELDVTGLVKVAVLRWVAT